MAPLNEADTRAKLIDPKLKAALWGESQIEREHYFVKGQAITNGRIYLIGEEAQRREPQRVDYLLRYQGQMIPLYEAREPSESGKRVNALFDEWESGQVADRAHLPALVMAHTRDETWSFFFLGGRPIISGQRCW